MSIDQTAQMSSKLSDRVLDPVERVSEVLFGLIMALTFTCTLGVVTAGHAEVRTMLLAALGCNLAWGIIDGSVFVMARFNARCRDILQLHAVRSTKDHGAAQRMIADALPPLLAAVLPREQLEVMRQGLLQLPEPERPRLTRGDWVGASGIFLLSFLSTFPIVIPFMLIGDARLALRVSNAIAVASLFLCGYILGRYAGYRPPAMGIAMVAVGGALVGVAIMLGG
jgi:hypothetical protein